MDAVDRDGVIEHRSSELELYIVVGDLQSRLLGFQFDRVLGPSGGIVVGSGRLMEV